MQFGIHMLSLTQFAKATKQAVSVPCHTAFVRGMKQTMNVITFLPLSVIQFTNTSFTMCRCIAKN